MKVLLISPSARSCRYKEVYNVAMKNLWNMDSDKCINKACRTTLIILFILQLVSTLERQVFDFLGYMWAPIIGNFFQIILVVIGIFGACNFYRSLVIVYATWSLLWLGWNIFVICLYLEVGILNRNRERYILTIGTEGKSWWLEHGIGCEVTNSSLGDQELSGQERDSPSGAYIVGCILQYYYVEVIHAAVQCLLSLLGFMASCTCIYFLMENDGADDPMSSNSDKLEFVKMRYCTPTHMFAYEEDMAIDNIYFATELSPSVSKHISHKDGDLPPSYDTAVKDIQAKVANQYYSAERNNIWSKASNRSNRSSTQRQTDIAGSKVAYNESLGNLPWAQMRPSAGAESHLIRHYS